MKSISIIVFLVFIPLITGCNGKTKTRNTENCTTFFNQANCKLNEYYLTHNDSCLYLSLNYIEKALSLCTEHKASLFNLKITLLMLLHKYEEGYEFVDSVNNNNFAKPYKKNLYLKTFKALAFEVKGDTLKRDRCFNEVESEIKYYLSKHQSDKEAISDLFFIKAKHTNIGIVIKEIELLQDKNKENIEFFESLKETIKAMHK